MVAVVVAAVVAGVVTGVVAGAVFYGVKAVAAVVAFTIYTRLFIANLY